MRPFLIAVALSVAACGQTETKEVAEVVKQTVDAIREKQRVVVRVRLVKSEPPAAEDLEERRLLEEEVEVSRIGQVVATGGGVGYYDFTIEVDSTAEAVPRIESMLRAAGVNERASVRVLGAER